MSDYANGLYFFTVWAAAAGVSGAALREHAVKNLGAAYIETLGKYNHNINFGALESVVRDLIDAGASPTNPTTMEMNGAVVKAAGVAPSLLDAIFTTSNDLSRELPGAISAVGDWSTKIVLGVAIIAVVVGIIYLGNSAKGLKVGKLT